jgi:hypothetical protein
MGGATIVVGKYDVLCRTRQKILYPEQIWGWYCSYSNFVAPTAVHKLSYTVQKIADRKLSRNRDPAATRSRADNLSRRARQERPGAKQQNFSNSRAAGKYPSTSGDAAR